MSDAAGFIQFLSAVAELARGGETISVPPIWERHLLTTNKMPHVTCNVDIPDSDGMVHCCIHFGAAELSTLRSRVPLHLRRCSDFDILTACLWRCRTIALSPKPNEEVRILIAVNFRKLCNPPLPNGYYGNAIAYSVAISTAGELSRNPLHYALELVRKTKMELMAKLKNSSVDQLVIMGHQNVLVAGSFTISDLTHIGFEGVDFGWGKPVYGGPMVDTTIGTFYIPFKNNEDVIVKLTLMCLPANAMEAFMKELEKMLKGGDDGGVADRRSMSRINSAL